ncbi:MAG: 3-phosphoshikimate 1-carboxyvinyltransferase [Gammaproteobacteria bacterium]|nr:3-phosphoshikimate 1-carboxyvinyltransferase [Gammaproteobacteria bacterium]
MNLIIKKTYLLKGQVAPPGSKSQTIRAIILASLCSGESVLENTLDSDDTQDAIAVCKQLGATISKLNNTLNVKSNGLPLKTLTTEIDSGNSGVATHFVMPILGLRENVDQAVILNCREQMRARPIKSLISALIGLGLNITYLEKDGALPVSISGKLIGGKIEVDGMTSQYLSALLFALPCAQNDSEITVRNLPSRHYAEMTLNYLKNQKIQFRHRSSGNADIYYINGRQTYHNFSATISGDFSSASYLIAAAVLIPGEIVLEGLSMTDTQGDKQFINILNKMGASIQIKKTSLIIQGGRKLTGIKIDANHIPDLLPTLAVIGTFASGKTDIANCVHARIKETDRIHSMSEGLSRMGAKIEEKNDGLVVYESKLYGSHVKGYGDHRTVMALSIAGMIADGITVIDDAEAIRKTFPEFVKTLQSLGAQIESVEND